jgi:hypothetical protein
MSSKITVLSDTSNAPKFVKFCRKEKYVSFCHLSLNKISFLQKDEVPYVSSILIN